MHFLDSHLYTTWFSYSTLSFKSSTLSTITPRLINLQIIHYSIKNPEIPYSITILPFPLSFNIIQVIHSLKNHFSPLIHLQIINYPIKNPKNTTHSPYSISILPFSSVQHPYSPSLNTHHLLSIHYPTIHPSNSIPISYISIHQPPDTHNTQPTKTKPLQPFHHLI